MEWKLLLNQDFSRTGPYTNGFDRNAEYEFKRGNDGEPFNMRLADQAGWFNVAGLWFRPTPPGQPSPHPSDDLPTL